MTRETRLNLWFLTIFLVISLPGAVILFIKKLDPAASRMDEPDAVQMQLPYMAPVPAPPQTRWIVPAATHQWLAELTRQKTGRPMVSAVPPGPEWEPVISADHWIQVMSLRSSGDTTDVALVLWQPALTDDVKLFTVELTAGGRNLPARVSSVEPVEIPGPVRHELVGLGFDHPPKRIHWMQCAVTGGPASGADARIDLTYRGNPALRTAASWTVR